MKRFVGSILLVNRIAIASRGSQRPEHDGHDESPLSKNRRDDLLIR
ncbi:MAG TPA: hypothetical protein VHK47_08070 [Polyangia bacterium]|jgi:hypothetical protein|nr:hypothetical protein [Polyangia bacterium]